MIFDLSTQAQTFFSQAPAKMRLGKTQRKFQQKKRQKAEEKRQKAFKNVVAVHWTKNVAAMMALEAPILTEDNAVTLLRFLNTPKWAYINKEWLFLMEEWLRVDDESDKSWKQEGRTIKRSFDLKEGLDRLGTDGPSRPKLRRMNASSDLGKLLDNYTDVKDDFRRFCSLELSPPPDPEWCEELDRRAREWLLEMDDTPPTSIDSESG
jgi:hypothetical protein